MGHHLLLPSGIHTWRSNSEVFNFLTAVGKRHDTNYVRDMFPRAVEEQTMLRNKGPFCFYKNEHPQFCQVRKVRPLDKALKDLSSWITSLRLAQASDPRADILVVQVDLSFEGIDGEVGILVNLSSLANIDTQEIWNSPLAMNEALNSVHSQVQKPFECELCTQLVFPSQHKKDGIGCWCWEEARSENCVLHRGGIKFNGHNIDGPASTTTSKGTRMKDVLHPEDLSEAWLVSVMGGTFSR